MMKKILTGCAAAVLWGAAYGHSIFGGSVMKSTPLYDGSDTEFTGRLEDRVNLWPLGYYREPAFSLLWPVFSVTDDHLAIRPIYTQYRQRGPGSPYDEFNFLWPLCQFDTRHDDYRVFPFFWGDDYFVAFPAFFHVADTWVVPPVIVPGDGSGFGIFPLAVFDWSGSDRLGCVFPAFYSHSWNDGKSRTAWFAAGLCGWKTRQETLESSWLMPLYWARPQERMFASPFWASQGEMGDRVRYGGVPALLTFAGYDPRNENRFGRLAGGLVGWNKAKGGVFSNWAFPLYYRDNAKFLSLPWSGTFADGKLSGWCVLPALTWRTDDGKGNVNTRALLGLYGSNRTAEGFSSSWIFPLYYRDSDGAFATLLGGKTEDSSWVFPLWYEDKNSFFTIPYGFSRYGDYRQHILPLLLSEIHRGKNGGGERWLLNLAGREKGEYDDKSWLFPLWYRNKDDFYSLVYGNDAHHSYTNNWWGLPIIGTRRGSESGGWIFPLASWNRNAESGRSESGVLFHLLWSAHQEKREETVVSDSSLLCNLLWRSHVEKGADGTEKSEESVLWRVWHRVREDGNVAVDVFPFITYDSKTNGFTKTSFFWRLFRYEKDPESGTKVDLLFLPVWR